MKKAQFLKGMKRRFTVAGMLVLGLMLGTFVSATAQAGLSTGDYTTKLSDLQSKYETLQQTFAPESGKWNAVEDVIEHIENTRNSLDSNPNYLVDTDGYALDRANNPVWLKIHPSVLAEYTPSQLAQFQTSFNQLVQDGLPSTNPKVEKLNLILEVNAN